MLRLLSVSTLMLLVALPVSAQEKKDIFSGPQVGEKMPAFKVKGVYDDLAGKELDYITKADGKPIVLVFIHDFNRLSLGMVRFLTTYTASRSKDGLHTGVIWLTDDVSEAENYLKRIAANWPKDVPLGISGDGKEGPGKYGLNRNVMLTILVGKEGKVTANFALVQPSLQVDLPKIVDEVVKVAGGKAPTLEQLTGMKEKKEAKGREQDPMLRPLISAVIKLDAKPEEVEKAAKALEEYAAKNEPFRKEVGRIANTIINGGKIENYGTAKAQEYLKKWAKEYGEKR